MTRHECHPRKKYNGKVSEAATPVEYRGFRVETDRPSRASQGCLALHDAAACLFWTRRWRAAATEAHNVTREVSRRLI